MPIFHTTSYGSPSGIKLHASSKKAILRLTFTYPSGKTNSEGESREKENKKKPTPLFPVEWAKKKMLFSSDDVRRSLKAPQQYMGRMSYNSLGD
tara:strand:- start:11 stop:292 length:282 start_codon:yes stop_codon:yes gene_type:complete